MRKAEVGQGHNIVLIMFFKKLQIWISGVYVDDMKKKEEEQNVEHKH